MKKVLALVLVSALMFALAIPAAANEILLPAAPKADIIIDGVRDDGYGEMFEINSYKNGDGDGATAKVWAAWNDTGIFYYLEVSDTTPNHDHSDRWQRDCVEFFIDWNAAIPDANSNEANPSWQLRIASAPNEDGMQQSCRQLPNDDDVNDTLKSGTHFVVKPLVGNDLTGGYIMEVWLPIAFTNGNANPLAEGRNVFVDFQVADNQHGDGRSSQAFLDGMHEGVDTQNNNPSAFRGILPLGAALGVEVEEDIPDAIGGGEEADAEIAPVIERVTSPRTNDAGIMALIALMAIAAMGIVVLRKKTI